MTRAASRRTTVVTPFRPALVPFRFDKVEHVYRDTDGTVRPHITGMLKQTGWVDDRWYTAESRIRGQAVHKLAMDWDLGALVDLKACTSPYKGWLAGHVRFSHIETPAWDDIEVAYFHPLYRFGGRPDRVGTLRGVRWIVDLKTGGKSKHHAIQTALQAILAEQVHHLPARYWKRGALYLTREGRYKLDPHEDQRDLHEAMDVIRECCA